MGLRINTICWRIRWGRLHPAGTSGTCGTCGTCGTSGTFL